MNFLEERIRKDGVVKRGDVEKDTVSDSSVTV